MRVAAWVLLAAYLPLLVASSVHTHRLPEGALCDLCAHHVAHPSHFSETIVSLQDCLVCHLMSFSYFGAAAVAVAMVLVLTAPLAVGCSARMAVAPCRVVSLRAPPIC